jgi:tRNA threonylcarbamoyl adenosine modification protein YeaZ
VNARPARASTGPILAIDTATESAVIALGRADGTLSAATTWEARHRHGEELLARIDELLDTASVGRTSLGGVVVGTGPGAFTGLRVGLATAKAIAHGLAVPIAGVMTGEVLLEAARRVGAGDPLALLLPAGPADAVLVASAADGSIGTPVRLPGGALPVLPADVTMLALDLDGRSEPAASELGGRAREGMAEVLLALGARRLATGGDDLARLVPEYVTLPRGVEREAGGVMLARA